ncbi:hypothetical protein IGI04_030795 [Brassica rapa subsp. trilocularis]|uniref:Uncharacterized protein n=1 Tax=Brassica rapa subsp. trilocularis TaxID=1813537 RepID=A0ABQ7LRS7_BRACM|nr:hypothetical protein IGI04_030795 [Brassica rapa subsp. trilocularis]
MRRKLYENTVIDDIILERCEQHCPLARGTPRHPEEDKQKNCNSRWSQDEGGEFLCDVWVARLQRPLEIAITVG